MTPECRILFVADPTTARRLEAELASAGIAATTLRVDTDGAFRDALDALDAPDVILGDAGLRGFGGAEALRLLRARDWRTPFIMFADGAEDEPPADVLRAGADDFLPAARLARLGPSVRRALANRDRAGTRAAHQAERLAAIVRSTDAAVIGETLDGVVTDWNPGAERVYGYTAGEAVGRPVEFLVPPDRRDELAGIMARLGRGERIDAFETVGLRKDGTRVDVAITISPIRDAQGRAVGASKIARDITPRKRAEAALEESNGLLRSVAEGVPQALFVKDRAGRYLLVNSPGARLVGKSVEDVLGRDDTALFDAETARRVAEVDRRVMGTGEPLTREEAVTAGGVTRTYLTTKVPYRGPDGEVRGVIGVALDITERKAAEEQLRRQNEILQTIFDHIPVMINFVEPPGLVQLVNREWERVMGWTLEEVRSRDMAAEFYPDPDERRRVLEYIRRPTPGRWSDFKTRVRDGRVIDTSWANVLLSDGTSIGIGLDVTDQKRAEAERERLYRDVASARELLEVMSRRLIEAQEAERRHVARELHDEIGQILTAVNLILGSLRSRVEPAGQAQLDEGVQVVNRAIEQVRALSLDLRPASLDMLGLEPALRAYLARVVARSGLVLEFASSLGPDRLPPALETVCFRVVQEAVTNVLRHARAPRCRVALGRTPAGVVVTVADAGVGFDVEATRERVLRGEGFGLLGMMERVQLFGGRIDIDSTPGRGTIIRATFPVPGQPSAAEPEGG